MEREQRRRLAAVALAGVPHGPDAGPTAEAAALGRVADAEVLVLVEGVSDQIAVETLAARRGQDLTASAVVVVPINGAQAIARYVRRFGPAGAGRRLVGLCDAAEQVWFERALLGPEVDGGRPALAALGFFVCDRDLEEELIRAAGRDLVEAAVEEQGDGASFRSMRRQPHWRDEPLEAQFHRWLRAGAGRNLRYARLLVEACDRPPAPLVAVLDAAIAR